MSPAQQLTNEATKALPTISTLAALVFGIPLNSWVLLASLFYTFCLTCRLAWKWRVEWRHERDRNATAADEDD